MPAGYHFCTWEMLNAVSKIAPIKMNWVDRSKLITVELLIALLSCFYLVCNRVCMLCLLSTSSFVTVSFCSSLIGVPPEIVQRRSEYNLLQKRYHFPSSCSQFLCSILFIVATCGNPKSWIFVTRLEETKPISAKIEFSAFNGFRKKQITKNSVLQIAAESEQNLIS